MRNYRKDGGASYAAYIEEQSCGSYADGTGINAGRVVLHADLNSFFASVECHYDPSLRAFPVAVCGDPAQRHGIVLAKNDKAKKYGVRTGDAIWQAQEKCPGLKIVIANYGRYMYYSHAAREIMRRYTDRVEPFGMDEAWLDMTHSRGVRDMQDGKEIADELREVIRRELDITASVGVSDNKIFSKLGSDYRKPDATTVLSPAEYESLICPLPVSELIFAGPAVTSRLARLGVHTIGEVAAMSPRILQTVLGKNGVTLWQNCRGENTSPVELYGTQVPVKSVSNSTTPPRDVTTLEDVRVILASLCDSVATRLRQGKLKGRSIGIVLRSTELEWFGKQRALPSATSSARELFSAAMALFSSAHDIQQAPLRSLGVRVTKLERADGNVQASLFDEDNRPLRADLLGQTVDDLRRRFGYGVIGTGTLLCDTDALGKIVHGYEVFTNLR